jgi:hypothetical protein
LYRLTLCLSARIDEVLEKRAAAKKVEKKA